MKSLFGKLSGKGIIAAACACLVVVGGAGIYSYNRIADKLNDQLVSSNAEKTAQTQDTPVNAEQTQIAKTTEPPVTERAESETAVSPAETDISEHVPNIVSSDEMRAMVRPLNGEVLVPFSEGELVKSSTLNVWKTHDGVDIAGNLNEKVKSMTSGNVVSIYEDQMLGACVKIDHGNGLEGFYCNLSKDIPIVEGQTVSAGTIIGMVGDTAQGEIKESTHLHFALKKDGEWIDPISFISGEGS
ncbi:MAG: M23 family metallopeptidase [Oscillospiraceae bacterium]|nr:M23 family metallopeptidase [Oscillospiraceae bacterium]